MNNKSCQTCVEEMAIFCRDCPHINTNRGTVSTRIECWIAEQYNSVTSSDYRKLNKLQDELIFALRAYEIEIEKLKEVEAQHVLKVGEGR